MKKVVVYSMFVVAILTLSGCNPDSRLNGIWEGTKWENGGEVENSAITFDFNDGIVKASRTVGPLSLNYQGTYTTDSFKIPSKILFSVNIINDNFIYVRKGIYRFSFPIFGKTLYLSIAESEEGDYPDKGRLDANIGPVYVLEKR
ncbi:MAG TPA: hypothetical protein PLX23_11595 [Candidatus Hydrogenedens sp.]|nr:hypothetical protein [Candidatus Hydrogenedens sp.]